MEKKHIIGIIIGVIIFALLLSIGGKTIPELFWNNEVSENWEQQCQESIKYQLKSPASAVFSEFMQRNDNTFSYNVDSQNAYWAMLRSRWLCVYEDMFNLWRKEMLAKKLKDYQDIDSAIEQHKKEVKLIRQQICKGEKMQNPNKETEHEFCK